MPITNGYIDLSTLKSYLGISQPGVDDLLVMAANAASRAVDAYCQRRFWLDPTPVARTYEPKSIVVLQLPDDIGTQDGLAIATDAEGDGVYETSWAPTDFILTPVNAPQSWPEARPWTGVRAVGTQAFPWTGWGSSAGQWNDGQWGNGQWGDSNSMFGNAGSAGWLTRLDRVQITARWGWPEVPAAVTQATFIKAARLFQRKDSPQGVAGFGEFGPIRVSTREDPDICQLLMDYQRMPVAVA